MARVKWTPAAEQKLSVAIAVVLLVSYGALLLFSLVTHRDLFSGEEYGPRKQRRTRTPNPCGR